MEKDLKIELEKAAKELVNIGDKNALLMFIQDLINHINVEEMASFLLNEMLKK